MTRCFAYNPTQSPITGTDLYGTLAVQNAALDYSSQPGGIVWWMGPDETTGYVIATVVTSSDFPTPLGDIGTVQFWRTNALDPVEFTALAGYLAGQTFGDADVAKAWLESNNFWTSYGTSGGGPILTNLEFLLDAANYTPGSLWADETGNGNNATVNGATWSSTDGGIFDLNGSSDTISIPHTSNLSLSTTVPKTIQVWVKFDTLPALNQQVPVFGKLSSSFGFDGYWGGLFSNTGLVRCTTNGTAVQRVSTSALTVTTNTWYLFTFVSQITSVANTTKVYINETEYITAAHGNDSYNETNPLYLGWIGSGVSSAYLNGKIGAAYFYTTALSAVDVSTNFNNTKTRFGL